MIVGIDPQPSLIAWHVRDEHRTVELNSVQLRKKACFKNAQDWQEYIYIECSRLIQHLSTRYKLGLVIIEQQRGRVNSNIEMALLVVCIQRDIPRKIVHPLQWKKAVGLPPEGDHLLNKKISLEAAKARGVPLGDKGRVHDLADAYWISFSNLNK
jgi:hypothetical protein